MEKKLQTFLGKVVSTKMQKTITVLVERRVEHPLYGKVVRLSKRYHAHDADESAQVGDLVEIVSCRPLSKSKKWQLSRVVEREMSPS